jgi:hypothetical protein
MAKNDLSIYVRWYPDLVEKVRYKHRLSMKRVKDLYEKIYCIDNLGLADKLASRGKSNQYGVRHHLKNREENLRMLQTMLESRSFKTSKYTTFEILEPKRRHWVKEELKVRHYFRYCDDMVFLASDKTFLHKILARVRDYLWKELRLTIKPNYQLFPVEKRGIDFVGYKFYHTHTMLRKSIKKNFARAVARGASEATIAAYKGWAKHADTNNLLKKLSKKHDEKIQPIWNKT